MTHLQDDDLVLHYYGEMDVAGDAAAAAHLGECAACHGRYLRLQRVMAAVDSMPAPMLPDSFERTVWARLEPQLHTRRAWLPRFLVAPSNLAWAATVVLLVVGAFFAGRVSRQQAPTPQRVTAEQVQESILLMDLTEHLNRSQAMLVELVSAEEPANADGVDITIERGRAEELVAANRLYRQTATQTGDVNVGELLDELERLLVEVAASPDHLSSADMDRVKQRIAAKDLLFKVRVVASAIRARQTDQIRARAGQSS